MFLAISELVCATCKIKDDDDDGDDGNGDDVGDVAGMPSQHPAV